jgi:hypothetical protein
MSHALSGNLDLSAFPPLDPGSPVERIANITLCQKTATGTISIVGMVGGAQTTLMTGSLTANYNTTTVLFPCQRCVKHATYSGVSGTSFTGTVDRTYAPQTVVPAVPAPWGLIGLMLLLFPAGFWAIRRTPRRAEG